MSFFINEIEDLTYIDIESLVTDSIPESSSLEYKSSMIEPIKLAKVMTAFANGTGGNIVVGIKELLDNNRNKTGLPESIEGIPKEDYVSRIKVII